MKASPLAAALEAFGIDAASVEPLTSRPHTVPAGAYLVTTAAGRRLKIRFAHAARPAARSNRYLRLLADRRVPPPLAIEGRVMLDDWVEGTLLTVAPSDAAVDGAADLLAGIHGFRGKGFPRDQSVSPIERRMRRQLAELVAAGVVGKAIATELERIAGDGLPDRARWGLVHGDFCGENLVLTPEGTVVSIDNAHAGTGFFEYDLGRSWYRWPRPDAAVDDFERRYDGLTGRSADPEERRAWRAAATVKGLHLRHRHRWPLDRPLASVARLTD